MKVFLLKIPKKIYIFVSVVVVLLVLSLISYFSINKGVRRQFIYESVDGKTKYIESRYLSSNPEGGNVVKYVEELVLGPVTERAKPLFPIGTKVLHCFERDGTLYIDLSFQSLLTNDLDRDFEKVFALAEKNIKYNFPSIKHVEFFVEKRNVFEKKY